MNVNTGALWGGGAVWPIARPVKTNSCNPAACASPILMFSSHRTFWKFDRQGCYHDCRATSSRFTGSEVALKTFADLDGLPWVPTPLHIGMVSHVQDPPPDSVQHHLQQFIVCSFRDHILESCCLNRTMSPPRPILSLVGPLSFPHFSSRSVTESPAGILNLMTLPGSDRGLRRRCVLLSTDK